MTGTRGPDSGPRHEPTTSRAATGPQRLRVPVVAAALLGQGAVAYVTFVLGLVWGGWTYVLANLVAVSAFAGILLGARASSTRRLMALLAVPVACGVVTATLYALGTSLEEAAACDDAERAAVTGLRDPAGDRIVLEGSYDGECLARPDYVGPRAEEYRHYVDQLERDGWRVVEADAPGFASVTRRGVRVTVQVEPREGITLISVWVDPGAD